jgi:hypothetical protein
MQAMATRKRGLLRNHDEPAVTENDVRCQVCGNRYQAVTPAHLRKHDVTTADYQAEWGALSFYCLALRRQLSARVRERSARVRFQSVYVPWLPDQIACELRRHARGEKPLMKAALLEQDNSLASQAGQAFGSWSEALKVAGLPSVVRRAWTREDVVEAVRHRAESGKGMNSRAVQHDGAPPLLRPPASRRDGQPKAAQQL